MGLSQQGLATLLAKDRRTIQRLEGSGQHRCMDGSALKLLRMYLLESEYQSRLVANVHPHPFPEDVVALAIASASTAVPDGH